MMILIDNYDSFTYNLYQMLSGYESNIQVFRPDKIDIETLKHLSPQAIILSPGPGHPKDATTCLEIIRHFSGKIPILGVCLGHQAIVHAFGGKVVCAQACMHGKTSTIAHQHHGLFRQLPNFFTAGRYHSLIADTSHLPPQLAIHATTDDGIIMAVKHRLHPTYGLQFHPESILTPDGHLLIKAFIQVAGEHRC